MTGFRIGKVTHYYNKIGVAVVDLDGDLSVGDNVRFERGGENVFTQKISSIQVEHEKVASAKKGDTVGLKVDAEAKEGSELYKVVN